MVGHVFISVNVKTAVFWAVAC